MADAVFYLPDGEESTTGPIICTISGSLAVIEADGRPFILVDEYRWNYDATHCVVNGVLTPLS